MKSGNDIELFKGTARYYAKYRPKVPDIVIKYLESRFNLDGTGKLLDVGCGTGQLTFPLAKDFNEVIAIDTDEEMLDQAKIINSNYRNRNKKNIVWQKRSANEISNREGKYKLITFCRSFHWVDRYKVLNDIKNVLEHNGGIAILGDGSFWTGKEEWQLVVKQVVKKYLGEERRAGNITFSSPDELYEDMLLKNGYSQIECMSFDIERAWTVERIKGWLYSSSFASKRLFGERYREFESDLKSTLLHLDTNGTFVEHASFSVISGCLIN